MRTRDEKNKTQRRELKKERKKQRKEKRKKFFRRALIVFILAIAFILVYGFYIEPNILTTHEYKLSSAAIPDSFYGIKIVHFTDLHYGRTINKKNLNKIKNKINELEPDILIFTGDLVDEDYSITKEDIETITSFLNDLNATIGKYSVWGNHDYKSIEKEYKTIMKDGGFNLLENSYELVYNKDLNPIMIYGITNDFKLDMFEKTKDQDMYKILIMHEPDNIDSIAWTYKINVAFAGHSHDGQVKIPFIKPVVLPDGCKKYYKTYYEINRTRLYVSNGIGTSFINIRINSIPSINLYRMVK